MYLALVRTTEVGEKKFSRQFEVVSKDRDTLEKEVKAKVKKCFLKDTKYKMTSFVTSKDIDKIVNMDITRISSLIVTEQGFPVSVIEIEIQKVELV